MILTREALAQRINGIDVCCPICRDDLETNIHLFKECVFVKVLAFASKWNFRMEAI